MRPFQQNLPGGSRPLPSGKADSATVSFLSSLSSVSFITVINSVSFPLS